VGSLQEQPGGRTPAPGRLELVQAFVNTNDIEGRSDKLARPELAALWLREHRLLEESETVSEAEFVWLRDVRESLRALALANIGLALEDRPVAVLEDAAARTLAVRFGRNGDVLGPTGVGVARAIGALLAIVIDARRDGTWLRLKACRRDVCRWLFYDHSRNRASSWCSMAICGNRAKTRAYRHRRKSPSGEG
jgi:predicted RNA-binding Zn ribbon-like protein